MWALFLVTIGTLQAQETPRAAALEVLALEVDSACPDVPASYVPRAIRTTVGILIHRGDGSYSYGCPSTWGGQSDALAAMSPDGARLMAVSDGQVYESRNAGCTASLLPLPGERQAVDIRYWRDQFWVLAVDAVGDGGALLRDDGSGFVEQEVWTGDFRPLAMMPGGATTLWVTSLSPRPGVRRLSFAGGLTGGDTSLSGLPRDLDGLQSLRPTAADEDEAWMVVERSGQRWTWHVQRVEGDASTVAVFTDAEPRGRFVGGPVKVGDDWLGVIDSQLYRAPQLSGQWTALGQTVDWTCLTQVGTRVFACTVPALLAVEEVFDDAPPVTREVFRFLQTAPPIDTCASQECTDEFLALAEAQDLDPEAEPAVCPDGRTATDLDPPECSCAQGGRGGWLLLPLAWVTRRRAQSPPPANT